MCEFVCLGCLAAVVNACMHVVGVVVCFTEASVKPVVLPHHDRSFVPPTNGLWLIQLNAANATLDPPAALLFRLHWFALLYESKVK